MKCPYCGTKLNDGLSYCPECGGRLKPEDNSKDDTLRLPDLSGVPLNSQPSAPRARKSSPPPKKNSTGLIVLAVCAVIAAIAAAVCIAVILLSRTDEPLVPEGDTRPPVVSDEPQPETQEPEDIADITDGSQDGDAQTDEPPAEEEPKSDEPENDTSADNDGESGVIAEDMNPSENEPENMPEEKPENEPQPDNASQSVSTSEAE